MTVKLCSPLLRDLGLQGFRKAAAVHILKLHLQLCDSPLTAISPGAGTIMTQSVHFISSSHLKADWMPKPQQGVMTSEVYI